MANILNFCNGMIRVGYERRMWLKTCSFGIFVGAGSRNENPEENGIAHFIEHMLFKGTQKRTAYDIAREADSLGANINAYTSKTNTVFYISGLQKNLESYMELMSDMLYNSAFNDEDIERERGVVLEEIKMYDDDGESLCSDLMAKKYFEGDSLSRPILGTEETVKKFNADMIRDFMKRFYYPQNVFLVYVGPATSCEICDLVEKYFSPHVENKDCYRHQTIASAEFEKPTSKTIFATKTDKPFEQANIQIRFPSFGIEGRKFEAAGAGAVLLGSGMSSRLFQKIREEKGLVYEIYSTSTAIKGTGYVNICFATAPELVSVAVKAIREAIEEIKNNGFTEEEFLKIKTQRESAVVYSEEGTFDEMCVIGRNYCLTGKLVTSRKLYEKFDKLTLESINKIFNQIFDYKKAAVCYVGKPINENLLELLKNGGSINE